MKNVLNIELYHFLTKTHSSLISNLAFDCVNHHLLLKKLNYAGIRGIANNFFSSYLSDRYQIVQIND